MTEFLSPSYCNLFEGLILDSAERHYLIDVCGTKFFDLFANFGCSNLGHHPEVVTAAKEQIEKLMIVMTSDLINPPASELAEELVRLSQLEKSTKVYFGNSGAEANEAAIKLAHYNKPGFGISFLNAFHGRTTGILSHSTSKSIHRKGFRINQPLLVPYFGQLAAIDFIEDIIFKKIADPTEISYLITEPVRIEGGVAVPEKDFLPRLEKLCRENEIQFILDEVQTGFRRVGTMFAYQRFGVRPDIFTLGKAIASGLPLSATLSPRMNWVEGAQGSTFGGNIVSCATGLATVRLIEKLDISELERLIREHLELIREKVDVSGIGAIWALKFKSIKEAEELRMRLFKKKILTIPCGTSSIRIEPPLIFDLTELDSVLETITQEVSNLVD